MSSTSIEHADGLPLPQRYGAIATIALGIIMSVVDGAIANVALPTIAIDLHASPAFSIWIVNGYQLAITISLLPISILPVPLMPPVASIRSPPKLVRPMILKITGRWAIRRI